VAEAVWQSAKGGEMSERFPVKGRGGFPQGRIGFLCIALGLLLILASFGGSWGRVYGQTVVPPLADPRISKTADPSCCSPGDPVRFAISVTNVGTVTATNVVVSDTLPPELSLQEVTTTKGTVSVAGNHFEVDIGTVAPGEVVTIACQAIVLTSAPVDTVITNQAYLSSDQGSRQAAVDVTIRAAGACPTPAGLPPTGSPEPEAEAGPLPWLFAVGVLLLVLGTVLALGARGRPARR
jgi:uncharacterized repeat protein (TIGR01451 family)